MTPQQFHAIYQELIDENPLAVRAVLKILHVTFTTTVPTLAVTCTDRPELRVNLSFVRDHCRTEMEVKAAICHEFLHVLLRHTDRLVPVTPAEHLALDAVINAIIHRTLGNEASALMSRYYAKEQGAARLLRPPTTSEQARVFRACVGRAGDRPEDTQLLVAWGGLYEGRIVADDIRDLAEHHLNEASSRLPRLMGNHDAVRPQDNPPRSTVSHAEQQLGDALDTSLSSMNGSGIYRSPASRGLGASAYQNKVRGADSALEQWKREAYNVLQRHLLPDPQSFSRESRPANFVLPVLSPGDRRAALRSLWSPFLPDAQWSAARTVRGGTAQVYLDVSGSMDTEMPHIVALLARLSRYIRRPFWAFSTVVAPARIENGHLLADTTGGTSMACVLDHVIRTKPECAIVVTDGYIEQLSKGQLSAASETRLHVIVTRDGATRPFERSGIPYTQLSRLPSHDQDE